MTQTQAENNFFMIYKLRENEVFMKYSVASPGLKAFLIINRLEQNRKTFRL